MSLSHPPPNPDPTQRGQSAVPILQLRHPRERTGTPSAGRTLRSHPNPAALSTAQHSAAHPRPHSRKRSAPGPNSSPPPQKKTRSAFGTERRTDATSPIRPALRCASPAPSSAQRSSPASPGGGSRSSAPRFLLGPTRRHRSFAAIKASRRPESRASSRWDPRGGEGSPAAPPEQRSCRCWLRAPRKNQCASLIKPLHSRRALPSRPRAAKAALPPP